MTTLGWFEIGFIVFFIIVIGVSIWNMRDKKDSGDWQDEDNRFF